MAINPIKSIIRQWKAETPKVAKWIRNISASLSAGLPSLWLTLKATDANIPIWFSDSIEYIVFITAIITLIAGTKEKKK